MREKLENIKRRLEANIFVREAAISQGAVLPVVGALGWDTEDPDEVAPEWRTVKGRYALCLGRTPKVFLEVKQPGTFESRIEQLLQYASTEGVSMAVLSDGRRWSVYLPGEQGSYMERRVDLVDVVERSVQDVEKILRRYLDKKEVASGAYLENAHKDLHKNARRQRAKDAIPKAWTRLLKEPDGLISECLVEAVEEETSVTPSGEDVRSFLESVLKNTPATVTTETRKTGSFQIAKRAPNDPDQAFEKAVATELYKPKSPKTKLIYKKRWLAFAKWSTERGANWLPAEPEHVKNWIAHEWPAMRAKTLTHDLSIIRLVHRVFGMEDPVSRGSPARNHRRQLEMKEKKEQEYATDQGKSALL